MLVHVQSRAWSSSTLLRGLGLVEGQEMTVAGLDGQIDNDLASMQADLAALEAWGGLAWVRFCNSNIDIGIYKYSLQIRFHSIRLAF